MLQKPQSNRRALLGYALVLPLAGLLTLCTQPDQSQPQNEAGLAKARTAIKPVNVEGRIYDAVEESPTFPGGMKRLGEYLGQNLKYPEAAQKVNAEGMVFVNFILTKEGAITDVKVLKGIGFGADEEAVRVVSNMPRWIPARQDGKAVNVRYNLPINFQLEEDKEQPIDMSQLTHPKHFVVDGKEVGEAEFLRRSRTEKHWEVTKADPASQTIYITTQK